MIHEDNIADGDHEDDNEYHDGAKAPLKEGEHGDYDHESWSW